jgi:hypothetical protein
MTIAQTPHLPIPTFWLLPDNFLNIPLRLHFAAII